MTIKHKRYVKVEIMVEVTSDDQRLCIQVASTLENFYRQPHGYKAKAIHGVVGDSVTTEVIKFNIGTGISPNPLGEISKLDQDNNLY